jgi:hypothetical protein
MKRVRQKEGVRREPCSLIAGSFGRPLLHFSEPKLAKSAGMASAAE